MWAFNLKRAYIVMQREREREGHRYTVGDSSMQWLVQLHTCGMHRSEVEVEVHAKKI